MFALTSWTRTICTAPRLKRLAQRGQRADKAVPNFPAQQLADESLARNAEANRPAELPQTVQVREQLQVMPARLAEADAGIENNAVRRYTHLDGNLQPLFEETMTTSATTSW